MSEPENHLEMVGDQVSPMLRKRRFSGLGWIVGSILTVFIALAVAIFVLMGREFNHSYIDEQVHQTLQSFLGNQYEISIASSGLSFQPSSLFGLKSKGIKVTKKGAQKPFANLEEVSVGLDLFSVLSNSFRFNKLKIEGGAFDLSNYQLNSQNLNSLDLTDFLVRLREPIKLAEEKFESETISLIQITDFEIQGLKFGLSNAASLVIKSAKLSQTSNQNIKLISELSSQKSSFSVSGEWRNLTNEGGGLHIKAGPINSHDWFAETEGEEETSLVGLDSNLNINAEVFYSNEGDPSNSFVNLHADSGKIRLGPEGLVNLNEADFNFQIIPDQNKIQLDKSAVSLGDTTLQMSGEIFPKDTKNGLNGPLAIKLLVDDIVRSSDPIRSTILTPTIEMAGNFDPVNANIKVEKYQIKASSDQIIGEVSFSMKEAPSLNLKFESESISIQALKFLWPFFIASETRDWMSSNLDEGLLKSLSGGINSSLAKITSTNSTVKFADTELKVSGVFEGVSVKTFGELPPITNAHGSFTQTGNVLRVNASKGHLTDDLNNSIQLSDSIMNVANMFDEKTRAQAKINLSGSLPTLTKMANRPPLEIADKLTINPDNLTGEAQATIDADFQLLEPQDELKWKSKITISKASSKEPLFGKTIKDANMIIQANPSVMEAEGTAVVDGITAKIELTEPLGETQSSKRIRKVTAELDDKMLVKKGLKLDPVISGNLKLQITKKGDEPDKYSIDLTRTNVSLPWIGWLKGSGIPARLEFTLSEKNSVTSLKDFIFSGDGFGAKGTLSFDKLGLTKAELKDIHLVGSERFNVNLSRNKQLYQIRASGSAFDARSVINKVIHAEQYASKKYKSDVSLKASFDQLIGFNSQVMDNVTIDYRTINSVLNKLDVKGLQAGQLASVTAEKSEGKTSFNFVSNMAGESLAFVNLYKKMRGGNLQASLQNQGEGPYTGSVRLRDFSVIGEERLSSLFSAPASDKQLQKASGKLKEFQADTIKFVDSRARIEKGVGVFKVEDGRVRNNQIGITFEGTVFDTNNLMNMRGTFMPLFSLSRLVGGIPLIGKIFSNGKDSGLIGITYQLKGPTGNPGIVVNPISVLAPGVFRKIFEFQE